MTLAYPGEGNSSLCEQIAKDYFIASLADRDLELKIREREPRDLETAFRQAVRLEAYDRAVDSSCYPEQQKVKSGRNKYEDGLARKVTQLESKLEQVQKQKSVVGSSSSPATSMTVERIPDPSVEDLKRTISDLSKEVGRLRLLQEQRIKTCKENATPTSPSTPPEQRAVPAMDRPTSSQPERRCYFCGGLGHFTRDCAERKKQSRKEGADLVAGARQNGDTSVPGQSYIRLCVNGQLRKCLLDTGSDVTLLPLAVVANTQCEPTTRRLLAANGTSIKVVGTATVAASAGSHHLTITGLVSPHVSEIMLGIGFLQQQEAVWNFAKGEILLGQHRHKLCSRGHRTWCRRVILQDDTTIPPHSEVNLSTSVQYSDLSGVNRKASMDWVTEARQLRPGVHVSRTLVPEWSEDVPVSGQSDGRSLLDSCWDHRRQSGCG